MFYQSAFPEVEFLAIPYQAHDITKDNWFLTEHGIDRVMGELSRCGSQFTPEDIKAYEKENL